jgi:hypothetical protein
MATAQVGSGTARSTIFGGDIGAAIVESRNPAEDTENPRSGFTRKAYIQRIPNLIRLTERV